MSNDRSKKTTKCSRSEKKATAALSREPRTWPVLMPQFGDNLNAAEKEAFLSWMAHGSRTMLDALEAQYNSDTENWSLCVSLANCYMHYGRKADAVYLLKKAARTIPNEPEESWSMPSFLRFRFMNYVRVARACRKANLHKEVVSVCLDVLRKEKNNDDENIARIRMLLGDTYLALGKYSDLIDLMENRVFRKRGASFFAYWLLAVAYMRTGKTSEAMAAYVFGFNHLAKLFDAALQNSSDTMDNGFFECPLVPDCTREIADALPVEYGGTSLVVAAYLFGHGKYLETIECMGLRSVNSYKRASPQVSNLMAEVEYVARARQSIVVGDYETASRLYLKASSFAPSNRQRELRMTAQALRWDLRLSRVLKGEQRAKNLSELQRRIAGLKKDFEKIWVVEYGGDRNIMMGSTLESYWCIMKHSWVESLDRVLTFRCDSCATSLWRNAQRAFHEVQLTTFCKAFAAIEHFYSRFEQIAVQGGYASLKSFGEDEQAELLRLLEPGAEVKALAPQYREMDFKSLRKLMQAASKIDEIHAVVKSPERRDALRQLDGNRLCKLGPMWEISYLGKTVFVKDIKGMAYLAVLMSNQSTVFSPLSLINAATGEHPEYIRTGGGRQPAEGDRKSDRPDSPAPFATKKTLESVKDDLANTEAELNTGDIMDSQKKIELERRQDVLSKYIADISTKYGNIRSAIDICGRASKAVGKCIVEAMQLIETEGLSELAAHLRASIKHPAGRTISYTPSPVLRWEITSRTPQK